MVRISMRYANAFFTQYITILERDIPHDGRCTKWGQRFPIEATRVGDCGNVSASGCMSASVDITLITIAISGYVGYVYLVTAGGFLGGVSLCATMRVLIPEF